MRNNETDNLSAPASDRWSIRDLEPPAGTRAAWWFGIYFLAQLPLIRLFAGFYLYPLGLLTLFAKGPSGQDDAVWRLLIFVPYLVYMGHFIATLTFRRPRAFVTLLIILIILVCLNTVGCSTMLAGIQNIH